MKIDKSENKNPADWLEIDKASRRRKLRSGEKIDLTPYGIPGMFYGRGSEVYEYEDGTLVPIFNKLGPLLRYTFVCLIMKSDRILNKDEARFIRKHMNLSQDEFGRRLGITRETINRIESGKERVTEATSNNIRFCGLKFLTQSPDHKLHLKKTSNTPKEITALLTHLNANIEKAIKDIPKNSKLELAYC